MKLSRIILTILYLSDYFALNKMKFSPCLKLVLRRHQLHLKMQDKYSTD
jgi:hypothetical protein